MLKNSAVLKSLIMMSASTKIAGQFQSRDLASRHARHARLNRIVCHAKL